MEDNDEIFTLYIVDTILLLPFRFFQERTERENRQHSFTKGTIRFTSVCGQHY